jgi:hypothetical protein
LKPLKQSINFQKLKNPNKKVLSEDTLNLFGEFLQSGRSIPLYQQLLLEAKEQGHINEKYELSVIKIGTAFEVFLQELLVKACESLGINELQVEGKTTKNYKEAIQGGNLRDLLRKYLKQIIGNNSILSVKEYNHWHSKAYTLRNEIIHSGRMNVSEKEAMLAFESTTKLINLISDKVSQIITKENID